MAVEVKICGLTDPVGVRTAVEAGAAFVGFVFFARSPRALTPAAAAALTALVPPDVQRVGLFVDAEDDEIAAVVGAAGIDMLQLHGAESPARVAAVRQQYALPVIKAAAVASVEDVDAAAAYEEVADRLLFDARPPRQAARPGGNAQTFEWRLVAGRHWRRPWFLAGGLDSSNLAEAVGISGARAVDVSSGVEHEPGVKDVEKIREFLRVAARL